VWLRLEERTRTIRLKSILKLKETRKKMNPTEEEKLLEMQYLLEKTNLTKDKIDKVQQEIKDKKAEMDKLQEELAELMMLFENAHKITSTGSKVESIFLCMPS
jgi:vacuolar-type H+-ATPase subunit I/STV1